MKFKLQVSLMISSAAEIEVQSDGGLYVLWEGPPAVSSHQTPLILAGTPEETILALNEPDALKDIMPAVRQTLLKNTLSVMNLKEESNGTFSHTVSVTPDGGAVN